MLRPLVLLILLALIVHARAHEAPSGWEYPMACCHNFDCAPLDANRVKEIEGGYLIDGKHFVAQKDAKDSPDGIYHACFPSLGQAPRCFWHPPNSY